jgi:glycosyltransferase involved in cell wall biosynthesis
MTQAAPSRRVLAVTCNFPPDASVGTMRTLRLVRHLAEQGWDIDVLTVSPEGFRPGTVVDGALLAKVPPGVAVFHRRPLRPFERLAALVTRKTRPAASTAAAASGTPAPATPAPAAGPRRPSRIGALRRAVTAVLTLPDREISWLLPAVAEGRRQIARNRPDAIYSSGPPFTAHLVALVLAKLTGVPWVADFRDPWSRAPWREDRFAFERRAWAICERMVATRAQALVFVTATNRDDFAREYGPAVAARFTVVNNGCDTGEFAGLEAEPAPGAPFVLLHAGSLYGARNPAGLFRALAQAIADGSVDRSTFRLRFMGRIGIPNVDLPAVARELGLSDVVEFVSHVPRRQGLQAMVNASALLIVQPVTTVSIPAKLYEYMAAGRPILALAEPGGETAALVERTRAGITVLADDEDAVAAALGRVVALARDGFVPVARQAYDGDARASELRHVLERVIAGGRPR